MKLSPPKVVRTKSFALLIPNPSSLRVQTPDSDVTHVRGRDIANALARLGGVVCYTPGKLRPFIDVTEASEWMLRTWRGRPVSMTHKPTGVVVTSLRGSLNDAPVMFDALAEALAWLGSYGVAPGSVSSMAWGLFRSSLSQEVDVHFDPNVSAAAFFGGRQEVFHPDRYNDMVSLDMKAAYPHAMSTEPLAATLREVDRSTCLTTEPGFAAAEVFVPFTLPYAPLPVRVAERAIQFQYHELKGIWTWRELKAAREHGCEVRVTKCWAPRRTVDLFGPWWKMAQTGRALHAGSDQLAKMVANALWGQFAMKGEESIEVHFTGTGPHDYVEVRQPARKLPHVFAKHIASEVSSRVRVRTLTEALYGLDGFVAHVDTDGVIASSTTTLPANSGNEFGQWRVKEHMDQVDIRAPQLFRYLVPGDRQWHIVAAGMDPDSARAEFNRRMRTRTRISYLSDDDVNLPSLKSHQKFELAEMLGEAKMLGEVA